MFLPRAILTARSRSLGENNFDEEKFQTDWDGDCGDFDCDELEIMDGGLAPDSLFYFFDKFMDGFGDNLEIREEKIAEIKAMVEAGNYEAAKEALEKYKESAEELEKEIDPEKIKEAQKSSYTIKKTLSELEGDIPEEYRNDFVTNTLEREEGIRTAVEISSKIKELCVQLAELDPMEYSKMCKFDDDAPKWQKKLDKDLSAEQEKVAKEFVNVMKNCFKSSGQDCACEEIPFYDFSIACSKAAPLATACDIDGDEIACDELDNLDMPELPEWLEPIWKDLEMGMNEAQYDMHMPPECVKAGVTNPKECGRIMIKEHAPLECRAALLAADASSESEGREICDKIMFEKHSPQECIDKGLTSPKECAELMDNFRGSGPMDKGMGFGIDCSSIEDKMERLDCYDNKGNEMGEHYGVGEKFQDGKGELTWQCKENRIHWAPDCKKFMEEEWPEQEKMRMQKGDMRREQEGDWRVKEKECVQKCGDRPWDFSGGNCQCGEAGQYYNQERGFYGESECKDGCSQECGNQNTDCVNEKCVCLGGGDEERYTEDNYREPEDYYQEPPSTEEIIEPEQTPSESETIPEPTPEPTSEPESSPEPAPEPTS